MGNMTVLVVPADVKQLMRRETLEADTGISLLRQLQQLVGGYVEQVNSQSLRNYRMCMLVDEDGRVKLSPINERATLLGRYGGMIVGNAVFVGCKDNGYDWETLPKELPPWF
jgi:hypothetical protein